MDKIDNINKSVYQDDRVCKSYLNSTSLFPPEQKLLSILKDQLKQDARILDLGIGTGRTTPYLMSISSNYVGLDYSAQMVNLAKKKFPGVELIEGDVRDLHSFKKDEFDLAFFSFNGLDYISHDDRLVALAEIRRVMKPGGIFVFSSHNADYEWYDTFRWRLKPLGLRTFYHNAVGLKNRLLNLRQHTYDQTYSIITDPGHNYQLLTYYISAPQQIDQLVSHGFSRDTKVFDQKGEMVESSSSSSWLYYLTTKNEDKDR